VALRLHRQPVMTDVQAIDAITDGIIGAAIKVHRVLGPGLLHSAYLVCLTHELVADGHNVEVEKPIALRYGDDSIDCAFRADLMVDEQVIVEVKCIERFASVHRAQMLTYLKLTDCRVGLLINFNVPVLKDGIRRVANDLRDDHGKLA
jgi:GxxExxY protein